MDCPPPTHDAPTYDELPEAMQREIDEKLIERARWDAVHEAMRRRRRRATTWLGGGLALVLTPLLHPTSLLITAAMGALGAGLGRQIAVREMGALGAAAVYGGLLSAASIGLHAAGAVDVLGLDAVTHLFIAVWAAWIAVGALMGHCVEEDRAMRAMM